MGKAKQIWNIFRNRYPKSEKFFRCETWVDNEQTNHHGICGLFWKTKGRALDHCIRHKHDKNLIKEVYLP